MIGRLTGTIVEQTPEGACIVDVQGVGYEVFVPLGHGPGAAFLNAGASRGAEAEATTFHIHTHVREDALVLYGFASARDRVAFRSLLSVSGVGPKVALGILGVLDANALLDAIRQENAAAFRGISGVGKKTTERILLDLRDKLEAALLPVAGGEKAPPRAAATVPKAGTSPVVQALTQLGFRPHEAERAVAKLESVEDRPLEELIRDALALLG